MGLTSLISTNTIRGILISNDLLNVTREQLGDTSDNSVSEEDNDEYRTHRYLFMNVQYTILHSMKSELRVHVNDTNTYDVVDKLKALDRKSELWSMSIWTGFSFNCDGRKHLLRKSLGKDCMLYINALCTIWTTK